MLSIRKIYTLQKDEIWALFRLWNTSYPKSVAYDSVEKIQEYLMGLEQPEHLLLETVEGEIQGWYFEFTRDNDRWFGIIIADTLQGSGWGKKLMQLAQESATTLCGWVIDHDHELRSDGSAYLSPLQFYLKLGFELQEERLENGPISCAKITWRRPRA